MAGHSPPPEDEYPRYRGRQVVWLQDSRGGGTISGAAVHYRQSSSQVCSITPGSSGEWQNHTSK